MLEEQLKRLAYHYDAEETSIIFYSTSPADLPHRPLVLFQLAFVSNPLHPYRSNFWEFLKFPVSLNSPFYLYRNFANSKRNFSRRYVTITPLLTIEENRVVVTFFLQFFCLNGIIKEKVKVAVSFLETKENIGNKQRSGRRKIRDDSPPFLNQVSEPRQTCFSFDNLITIPCYTYQLQ